MNIARIYRQHGTHITPYAASIGLGSLDYTLINLDEQNAVTNASVDSSDSAQYYNLSGVEVAHDSRGLVIERKDTQTKKVLR